jgi:Lon protease-like protein
VSRLPLFPLGTVLVPTAVLPLHIFEPRYRALMEDLTGGTEGLPAFESEFGVVLIDRGSEVGGGDVRRSVGTVARLLEATQLADGRWVIAVVGTRRFRIDEWQPDAPYPIAEVTDLEEPMEWDDSDDGLLVDAERVVRRTLGLASELGEDGATMTFELADDRLVALWQLCAVVPVGPLDRQRLLESDDPRTRLRQLVDLAEDVAGVLAFRLARGQ